MRPLPDFSLPARGALAPFLDCVWSAECDGGRTALLLPGTGADLIVVCRGGVAIRPSWSAVALRPGPAFFTSLRAGFRLMGFDPGTRLVAARFRSGAVRHFGRLFPGEMIGRFTPAEEHLGPAARTLCREVSREADFPERAEILLRILAEILSRRGEAMRRADFALDVLYRADPGARVKAIARDFGTGVRQFERLVAEASGMSPKSFQRRVRLRRAMRDIAALGEGLLPAALSAGYFDQAHFIHEVRALCGAAPGEILAEAAGMSHFYNPRRAKTAILGKTEETV